MVFTSIVFLLGFLITYYLVPKKFKNVTILLFIVLLFLQIAYTSFKKVNARNVIIGKDKYLFEENDIQAWYGRDFSGADTIAQRMRQLKVIQDTLSLRGKTFVLVFAAGKGSFFPEYFPDRYDTVRGPTNYETYLHYAREYGITYIDFNRFFMANKEASRFPLFSKHGIHWSYYGTCLAADSLIGFIEARRRIDMPGLEWFVIDLEKAKGSDYDMGFGLNLIFRLKREKMAYPRIYYEPETGKTKPSVLVIADSCYWGINNLDFPTAFSDYDFWFYNKMIYPDSFKSPAYTDGLDIMEELAKKDVVILLCTEVNLPSLGWGFIQDTYKILYEKHLQQEVLDLARYIRSDKKWMGHIEKKALEWGIPVDSVVMLDANWGIREVNK